MNRSTIALAACLLVTCLAAPVAHAARFTNVTATVTDGALIVVQGGVSTEPVHGGLFVTFKEVGLGGGDATEYSVSATATAVYGCVNGGSNHPRATNKQTTTAPVTALGTFSSTKNGTVSGSLAVPPLGPGDFTCPSGQTQVLVSTSYTDVVLTDTTNGVVYKLPGTFTRSFY